MMAEHTGKETLVQWTYALGEWVHHDAYSDEAIFVIVWREYREGYLGDREQYGLIAVEDSDLDVENDKLTLTIATEMALKPYQEKP